MKGQTFTAPDGKIHKVLDFDEVNKMAYIRVFAESYRWVHEAEYSTWTVNDSEIPKYYYIPDMPAQMTEEQAKSVNYDLETNESKSNNTAELETEGKKPKKKVTKKKADAAD